MSYDSDEQSVAGGEPIEFYDFVDNSTGDHWRLHTGNVVITYGSYDYEPGIIARKSIERTGSYITDALDISLERGNDLARQYISGTPEGMIAVSAYRSHAANYRTIWQGFVETCEFDTNGVPILKCSPRTSFNSGAGKRRRCQRLCDHNVYQYGCNLDQENFRVDGVVVNISGNTITSSAFASYANGWFEGGKIVFGNVIRFIKSHNTNTVVITRTAPSVAQVGALFRAYPGCDKYATTCDTKFGNKLNFGGEEHLPTKNPFTHTINNLAS